jgi:hypothetical protein
VLPLLNATAHNLGGAVLLLVLVAVNYRVGESPVPGVLDMQTSDKS